MADYNWWDKPTNTGYYKGIYFAIVDRSIEVKTGEPTDTWYDQALRFIQQNK